MAQRLLVIGGSSGIGLATARLAAEWGIEPVLVSRDPSRADLDAERHAVDVRDHAALRDVLARVGEVDYLVSCTVARAFGPVRELDLEAARNVFDTKLLGPLAAIQTAQVREAIVLVSGVASVTPMRGGAITAAVNGAVEALVRTLAVELAPVRVNAVSPGIIDTPTWAGMAEDARAAMFDRIATAYPAGRVGTAEDVGSAILGVLMNGFITGAVIPVDGGHRLAAP
ncbi:MAG: SDR family oxidoreductase [Thermoleophilia bacterium]|nr:SDR family oxidoreductase [Thermoleophilia bacterium]